MSINHQIVTLSDNKKYFVLEELLEGRKEYCLILNVDDETDIRIVSKIQKDNKVLLEDIEENLLSDLSGKFKSLLEKEQEMYS